MKPHSEQQQLDKTLSEQRLFERVNEALNQELNDVEPLTQAKITAARLQALSSVERHSETSVWRGFFDKPKAVAFGAALSAVFSVVLISTVLPETEQTLEIYEQTALEALFIPELEEDPQMLDQLEFIAWLQQDAVLEQVEKGV